MPVIAVPSPDLVPPAPAPASTWTPVPVPVLTTASITPSLPTPISNVPAPIPPRISRELAHEGYVEMPTWTRGETRALRDASREYAHRHGLSLGHAAMVPMLEKGETINDIVRQHGASPDLPTAHTSDLPTPNNMSDVEISLHADIWRYSMHQEFIGLLQAGTFAPTPA